MRFLYLPILLGFHFASFSAFAQSTKNKITVPSVQEIVEMQAQIGIERALEEQSAWSGSSPNQCKYAIRVPDAVTPGTIALTFDDGPDPLVTPQILDVLKAHNVKASFFVVATKIEGNEDLIQRALAEGHIVGNHSLSHPNFHKLDRGQTVEEVSSSDHILRQFTHPYYFRFPYGNTTCEALNYVRSTGYTVVGWNIDTCDWAFADGYVDDKENTTCQAPSGLRQDYPAYVSRVVEKSKGGILLMHDVHLNTAETLDRLLTYLTEKNYRFVTIDDRSLYPNLNRDR